MAQTPDEQMAFTGADGAFLADVIENLTDVAQKHDRQMIDLIGAMHMAEHLFVKYATSDFPDLIPPD